MSGLPNFNYDAFFEAARALRDLGASVTNPAENGLPKDAPWEHHMRVDLCGMLLCERVVTLPGWERSRGANLEVRIARELGMGVLRLEEVLAQPKLLTPIAAPVCMHELRQDLRNMLLNAQDRWDRQEEFFGTTESLPLFYRNLKEHVLKQLGLTFAGARVVNI